MSNIIVILILLALLLPAIHTIRKAKKTGQCIGCPNASQCGKCHCMEKEQKTETDKAD